MFDMYRFEYSCIRSSCLVGSFTPPNQLLAFALAVIRNLD